MSLRFSKSSEAALCLLMDSRYNAVKVSTAASGTMKRSSVDLDLIKTA